jgi:antitoxin VapB
MALSIDNEEADRLARELAAATGETLTDAVVAALRERLAREQARQGAGVADRLRRLAAEVTEWERLDDRPPAAIVGYGELGLPR